VAGGGGGAVVGGGGAGAVVGWANTAGTATITEINRRSFKNRFIFRMVLGMVELDSRCTLLYARKDSNLVAFLRD
jgi:hypothetical protein